MNIKQVLAGLWAKVFETLTLWRLLTLACIVFASGISGTWFNDQFKDDLQKQRWGWFGAAIAGVAIFGGVLLAVDSLEPIYVAREEGDTDERYAEKVERAELVKRIGFWSGVFAVVIGVAADCVMSANYFAAGHDLVTAGVLGFYPSLLSVIGGVIEGVRGISNRNSKRLEIQTKASMDMKLKIELAKIEARKELAAQKYLITANGQNAGHGADTNDSQESDKKAAFQAWYATRPNKMSVSGVDVATAFGVSPRTGQRWLGDIRKEKAESGG